MLSDVRGRPIEAIRETVWGTGRTARLLALLVLSGAGPAVAQIVPPGMAPPAPIVPPSVSPSGTPTGVMADPMRVYGDDAPFLEGLDLLAGIGFNVSGAITAEYNDNVARKSGGDPLGARYKSKDDFIFRPSVTLGGGRALGRQQLFVSTTIGRDFYARNGLLNRNRFRVEGGMSWALGSRCSGRLQGGYRTRGTSLGTFEEVIPSTQEVVSFLASSSCRTATGISANLNYTQAKTTNHTDDPTGRVDRSFANVKSQGVNGGIGYPIAGRGEIGVQANWSRREFPNQLLYTGDANGNDGYGVNAFANYRLGKQLRLTGGIGKSWMNPKAPLAEDFSGLVWNFGANYTGPRFGASVSSGRSVNGSSGGSANYTISSFFNGTVTYKANPRMSVATGMALSNLNYRGINQLPETEDVRSAKVRRYFVGADYRLNRMVSLSLDFNHMNRSAVPDNRSYKANRVGLTARAAF